MPKEGGGLCYARSIKFDPLNLLNNAVDAAEGEKKGWVRIELTAHDREFAIRVMDSGPGIPVELRNKIFEPMFTTKEVGLGTGLGLSISSAIASSHGGKLLLDSNRPNTCFILRLPRARNIQVA